MLLNENNQKENGKNKIEYNPAEFTEYAYINLLHKIINAGYCFTNYFDFSREKTPQIIWRHDVDISMHRAYRLACIEQERGIKATYFVMLTSRYYNICELEIIQLIKKIHQLGHIIGLHFDTKYYKNPIITDPETLITAIKIQKNALEDILNSQIKVFSLHDTQELKPSLLYPNELCGMINVYSNYFNTQFKYCSDSNGFWRFAPIADLIDPLNYPRLHVLIHPEWWTSEELTPRQKVMRALNGRLNKYINEYDRTILLYGRPNF